MSDPNTDTRDVGREAGEDVKRSAERLEADARRAAEDIGTRARDEAWSQAERARSGVASEMSGIAGALRKAADEMRDGSPQERTFGQLAEGLADASDAVRDRDVGQLAGDLSDFARRNPVAFLGGAALAGFVATRFARASASTPRRSSTPSGGTPDTEYTGAMPAGPVDHERIPGPATTPVATTPGTGAPSTATPAPTATDTPGETR